jgi:hypothetical protein
VVTPAPPAKKARVVVQEPDEDVSDDSEEEEEEEPIYSKPAAVQHKHRPQVQSTPAPPSRFMNPPPMKRKAIEDEDEDEDDVSEREEEEAPKHKKQHQHVVDQSGARKAAPAGTYNGGAGLIGKPLAIPGNFRHQVMSKTPQRPSHSHPHQNAHSFAASKAAAAAKEQYDDEDDEEEEDDESEA